VSIKTNNRIGYEREKNRFCDTVKGKSCKELLAGPASTYLSKIRIQNFYFLVLRLDRPCLFWILGVLMVCVVAVECYGVPKIVKQSKKREREREAQPGI
jgi:hypothetical protein